MAKFSKACSRRGSWNWDRRTVAGRRRRTFQTASVNRKMASGRSASLRQATKKNSAAASLRKAKDSAKLHRCHRSAPRPRFARQFARKNDHNTKSSIFSLCGQVAWLLTSHGKFDMEPCVKVTYMLLAMDDRGQGICRFREPQSIREMVRRAQCPRGGQGGDGPGPDGARQPLQHQGRRVRCLRVPHRFRPRLPGLVRQGRRHPDHPARRRHQEAPAEGYRGRPGPLAGVQTAQATGDIELWP